MPAKPSTIVRLPADLASVRLEARPFSPGLKGALARLGARTVGDLAGRGVEAVAAEGLGGPEHVAELAAFLANLLLGALETVSPNAVFDETTAAERTGTAGREEEILRRYEADRTLTVRKLGAEFGVSGAAVAAALKRAKEARARGETLSPRAPVGSALLRGREVELVARLDAGESVRAIASTISGVSYGTVRNVIRAELARRARAGAKS